MALVQQTAAAARCMEVEARLARWLLQALDRGDGSTLALTQESLSQALGVRRTTLTLIACKFRDLGFIRYQRGRIDVVNRSGLEKAACECYATLRRRSDGAIGQAGAGTARSAAAKRLCGRLLERHPVTARPLSSACPSDSVIDGRGRACDPPRRQVLWPTTLS
jgi:hypothetical protein